MVQSSVPLVNNNTELTYYSPLMSSSKLRNIVITLIVLLAFGVFIDLFNGFYVFKHSKSIYAGLGGQLRDISGTLTFLVLSGAFVNEIRQSHHRMLLPLAV